MLFHYESKQYASISLQNYLTSLLTSRNLSVIIFYSHFNNQSGYSKCVKIATFYFLATNTLPHYFSTRCQIPPCHNIRIFQLHQNLQFTVYYCFLCWPLVHRRAIGSTFQFFFRQHIVILHLLFLLSAPNRQTDLPNLLDLLDLTVLPTRRQTRVESCAVWEFLGEISRLAEICFGRSKWQFTIQTRKFTLSSSSQEQILPFSMM